MLAAPETRVRRCRAANGAGLVGGAKRAYVIADNKLALNASWDNFLLDLEMADLPTRRLRQRLIGFVQDALDALLAEEAKAGRKG